MSSKIKSVLDLLSTEEQNLLSKEWSARLILSDQCCSYIAWNSATKEALLIDPKDTDHAEYTEIQNTLPGYKWIAVIDTHTHADHISSAAILAEQLKCPLVMHEGAISRRVNLRVSNKTHLQTSAGKLLLIPTPGHTPDSLTIFWGPFIFGGDTILYGDCGRDDLPGGNAHEHFESLQTIKSLAHPTQILLPGHDHKGGRASSWLSQSKQNPSLTQGKNEFIIEAEAFDAPAPELLKKSLKENFK